MGVNQEWLRTDGKAGSVDLSILVRAKEERIKSIAFRTVSGLWYDLSPLDNSQLQSDGTIAPAFNQKNEHHIRPVDVSKSPYKDQQIL